MFNNVIILKCIFQIANLAAVYNVDYPYYTLDNGCVICTFTKTSEPNGLPVFDFKFTGKYWTKTNINKDNKYDTYDIISIIIIRIDTDIDLQKRSR